MKSLFSSLLVVAFLCVTVVGCGPAPAPSSDGGAAPATEGENGDATPAGEAETKPEEGGSEAK